MTFLNPLDALIPKIPFSFFFPIFGSRSPPGPGGSVLVGFWGSCQLSPFWGRGGSGRRALSTPPPPETKNRPPLGVFWGRFLRRGPPPSSPVGVCQRWGWCKGWPRGCSRCQRRCKKFALNFPTSGGVVGAVQKMRPILRTPNVRKAYASPPKPVPNAGSYTLLITKSMFNVVCEMWVDVFQVEPYLWHKF